MVAMRLALVLACLLSFLLPLRAAFTVAKGRIEELPPIKSAYVAQRPVYVWLPDGYSPDIPHAVLYMHDGQMLFDAAATWNKQEWKVDETLGALSGQGRTRPCIVVAVPNNPELRHTEYFPQKVFEHLAPELQASLLAKQKTKAPLADNYLCFLVKELKPLIDSRYRTLPGAKDTFIMGSSMGGLISLYALCEYPEVFGGAACLSTHSPMVPFDMIDKDTEARVTAVFQAYLEKNLPSHASHRVYMDYGTGELDKLYPPYQRRLDEALKSRGYGPGSWVTLEFPDEPHSEQAWAGRLHIPLLFLLGTKEPDRLPARP